jgi:hypothetical protein
MIIVMCESDFYIADVVDGGDVYVAAIEGVLVLCVTVRVVDSDVIVVVAAGIVTATRRTCGCLDEVGVDTPVGGGGGAMPSMVLEISRATCWVIVVLVHLPLLQFC